jgi:hypothetical protein
MNKNNNRPEINVERILSLQTKRKLSAPEGLADKVLLQWRQNQEYFSIIAFNPKKHWYWAASFAVFCFNLWAISLYVLPKHNHMQASQVKNEIDMSQVYYPTSLELEYIDFTENGQ